MTAKRAPIHSEPFTQSPDGTLEFELTLSQEVLTTAYQAVLKESAARLSLPGFRPGKAPLALAEKQLDPAALRAHALEHAFPPVYADFVKQHALRPLVDPQVTPKAVAADQDWVLQVKVATFPKVKLGQYLTHLKAIHSFKDDKNKLPEIFDSLLAQIKFEVSPLLIEAETKAALSRLAKQLSTLKLSLEDYAKSIQKSFEELAQDYQTTAATNLRLEFILYEIGQSQGFKPEERAKTLDFLTKL